MKRITIELSEEFESVFEKQIQEVVNRRLSEGGLLSFIRKEIKNVFHSWQKEGRVSLPVQVKSLRQEVVQLKLRFEKLRKNRGDE